ncbi:MAG: hypothetical protein J0H52_20845 [Comamonadaceae bacterium]|nr:hypothetical protein [Comamonadaceae bacterium]
MPVQDLQVQATNEGFAYGSCVMLEFVTHQGFYDGFFPVEPRSPDGRAKPLLWQT